MDYIVKFLNFVQVASCLGLIGLVMMQTTKSEGLSGTIGGKMTSSFRGKPGLDDKLANYTKWCAILFFATSLLVYIVRSKFAV